MGGPVWHASGKGRTMIESRLIARRGLYGVGDPELGEWIEDGRGVVHVRRRLTPAEQAAAGIPGVRDIRGTTEERDRIALLLVDAPYLVGMFR